MTVGQELWAGTLLTNGKVRDWTVLDDTFPGRAGHGQTNRLILLEMFLMDAKTGS